MYMCLFRCNEGDEIYDANSWAERKEKRVPHHHTVHCVYRLLLLGQYRAFSPGDWRGIYPQSIIIMQIIISSNFCRLTCLSTFPIFFQCSTAYKDQYVSTYVGHTGPVYRICFSVFDETVFVSCGGDWTIRIWKTDHPTPLLSMNTGLVSCVLQFLAYWIWDCIYCKYANESVYRMNRENSYLIYSRERFLTWLAVFILPRYLFVVQNFTLKFGTFPSIPWNLRCNNTCIMIWAWEKWLLTAH